MTFYPLDSARNLQKAIEIASAFGAVVVAAHVNGPKGLLGLAGIERLNALKHSGLAAAELALTPGDPAEWMDPNGSEVQSWMDGTNTEGRKISKVYGSDFHSYANVGQGFTWVKMTNPNIEGLRLALLDGEGSVLLPDGAIDPNRHASNVIESITVTKAKYMGRPDPLAVSFNPWLNTIIGSRGTGKSTLIDFCRVALRREDELEGGSESSLRGTLEKRMRVPAGRHDEGLLTTDTVVEVIYQKDGERFQLAWDKQGRAAPISRLTTAGPVSEEGNISERFPVRIYSQKQLFDLAKDPDALLVVIDDTPEVRGADLYRAIKEAESKYLAMCAEARSLRAAAVDLPSRQAALGDVRRKIEILQQGGHATTLSAFRCRRRQDDSWKEAQASVEESLAALEEQVELLVYPALPMVDDPEIDSPFQALTKLHQDSSAVLLELRTTISNAVLTARTKLSSLGTSPEATAWQQVVAACEEDYERVTAQLTQAGIANPDEYRELLQRAESLEEEIRVLEQQREAGGRREVDAGQQLAAYRALRQELTIRRVAFASSAANDLIRAEVQGFGNATDFEAFLRDTLGIERFDEDHRAIVTKVIPSSDSMVAWSFQGLDTLVRDLRSLLSDPQKQWQSSDRRFEVALRRVVPERVDRLALYTPQDTIDMGFRDPRDAGNQWRKLSQGSPGQQTAALLGFVLGYGEEPIILDQPEDDLDNTLIYELLVQRLRVNKQSRQIIVVTHNPNIVVHGDAELVVSLEAVAGQSKVRFAGGLQEQEAREEICRVMEGGRQAFETRYRRISGLTRN